MVLSLWMFFHVIWMIKKILGIMYLKILTLFKINKEGIKMMNIFKFYHVNLKLFLLI